MTIPTNAQWSPLFDAHYLRPQKSSRIPRSFVFFDTEAWRKPISGGEEQSWRLGCTLAVTWDWRKAAWTFHPLARHRTPEDLWDAITKEARRDARTVVVAHNLSYDLRISHGLALLPALGWQVSRPTFTAETVGFEARKDRARLVCVDSLSLLPTSLAKVKGLLGLPALPLPDDGADEADWWARCAEDTEALARSYMAVIAWLKEGNFGGWARSGASIGWHTMLRRLAPQQVLVHGREEVRKAEVAAMYAGRAEVWRWGTLRGGPWYVWDAEMAFGSVCKEGVLPAVLLDEVRGLDVLAMQRARGDYLHLAAATVTTEVPVLPWRDDTGICWPVGTFSGWWWDEELINAVAAGARVTVERAWRYQAQPWLASWASWCLDLVRDDSTPEARVIGVAAKHWSRAVPGRTAMKYRRWEAMGDAYVPGVAYMPMIDAGTRAKGAMLTLGGQRWEAWETAWWSQALPQVLSYVHAVCRTRLWTAMTTAGHDHVVYCDTDSVIVDAEGSRRLAKAAKAGGLWTLRLKEKAAKLELYAPQLVEGTTYRRLAGIPKGARRRAQLEYDAEVWDGILTSLAEGTPEVVNVRRVAYKLEAVDTRRIHLPGGFTAPFTVDRGSRLNRAEEAG